MTSTQFILQMLQKEKEKLEQATEGGVEEVCLCVCVCVCVCVCFVLCVCVCVLCVFA